MILPHICFFACCWSHFSSYSTSWFEADNDLRWDGKWTFYFFLRANKILLLWVTIKDEVSYFSWSWWWLLFLTSKNRLNDFSFLSPSLFLSCRQSDSSALITLRGNLPYDTDALLLYRNLCFWEPFDCNMFFICLVSHVPSSHSRYKGNLSLILLWVFNLPDSSFTSLHLRQVTRVTKGFYF